MALAEKIKKRSTPTNSSTHLNQSTELGSVARPTAELVIGLVGAVGAGVSTTAKEVAEILRSEYGYESVTIIKLSTIIETNCDKAEAIISYSSASERITQLQEAGTKLRAKFGDNYLAAKAIEEIGFSRADLDKSDDTNRPTVHMPLRRATIIDSLKHQSEVDLFRETYGGLYWQFTVFAPENVRELRLSTNGVTRTSISTIFTKDDNDTADDHGQKVSKTAHLSDFFVRNDKENTENLKQSLHRFLEIVFGITVHTPNLEESGMYSAVSAASKSACLSRQVGAAIYSSAGEFISVGWNDVPRAGGGLYSDDHGKNDHRCYKWRDCSCHNDLKKAALYKEVFDAISNAGLLITEELSKILEKNNVSSKVASFKEVKDALLTTPMKSLIEYSRSIHAEMEAIISAARVGKSNLVGSTLYTTTFPCHNCARHIVAAGISKVIYIEPYSKSLAMELHGDAISLTPEKKKVSFLQYEGVGPSVSLKLFQVRTERKPKEGKAVSLLKSEALPVLPPPMDGFTRHEESVIIRIKEMETVKVS